MVLHEGEKVDVTTRRLFENDLRRHFVGEVKAAGEASMRLEGYVFVFDYGSSRFVKRPEPRVRVFGLADSGSIINVIPADLDLDALFYSTSTENHMVFTDGKSFSLDVNEFSAIR